MKKKRLKKNIKKIKEAGHRCRCPNNNLFMISLLLWVIFLGVELTNRIWDLYWTVPLVDIHTHFFGGAAFTTLVYWYMSLTAVKNKKWVTMGYSLLGAFIWEGMEMLEDRLFFNPPHLKDFFFWDGVGDILVHALGGLIALAALYTLKNRTNYLDHTYFK